MKVVALVSGGKDSCHAMYLATREGHEVVALANLLPQELQPDELDSYMFQTVGHQLVEAYAACMGVPLFRRRIQGTSAKQDMQYSETQGDEVEDLFMLLSYVKEAIPTVTAVCSGAIASDYQRLRVEHVCARLNLASLAYMWHQPQPQLLRSMIEAPIHAILVKVAALGLEPDRHLGRTLAQMEPLLRRLSARFGCNVCGEGGEYESLVLDCPLFKHGRIVLDDYEVVTISADSVSPVGYLRPTEFHVEPKGEGAVGPGDVRMMPDKWISRRSMARRSIEYTYQPGQFDVHVTVREGQEYVQVSCRPSCLLPVDAKAEASACTALHDCIMAVRGALSALGGTPPLRLGHHTLYVQLFLANMGHFAAVNNVYCRYFPAVDPPSRICIQLPMPVGCPLILDVLLARNAAGSAAQAPSLCGSPVASGAYGGGFAAGSPPSPYAFGSHAWGGAAGSPAFPFASSALAGAAGGTAPGSFSSFGSHFPATGPAAAAAASGSSFSSGPHAGRRTSLAGGAAGVEGWSAVPGTGRRTSLAGGTSGVEGWSAVPGTWVGPSSSSFTSGGGLGLAPCGISVTGPGYLPVGSPPGGRHNLSGTQEGGQGHGGACGPRSVLHVQSISNWAPSCIGPYSQANTYRGLIHMAGAIPLCPGSMAVVAVTDIEAQTVQALANCQAVAVGLGCRFLGASLGLTLYVAASAGREGADRALAIVERALKAGTLPRLAGDVAKDQVEEAKEEEEEEEECTGLLMGGGASWRLGGDGMGAGGDEEPKVDPYLQPTDVPWSLQPTVTVVVVEALPRGCLVEVVPLLVDVPLLDRKAKEEAGRGSDDEDVQEQAGEQAAAGDGRAKSVESVRAASPGAAGVAVPAAGLNLNSNSNSVAAAPAAARARSSEPPASPIPAGGGGGEGATAAAQRASSVGHTDRQGGTKPRGMQHGASGSTTTTVFLERYASRRLPTAAFPIAAAATAALPTSAVATAAPIAAAAGGAALLRPAGGRVSLSGSYGDGAPGGRVAGVAGGGGKEEGGSGSSKSEDSSVGHHQQHHHQLGQLHAPHHPHHSHRHGEGSAAGFVRRSEDQSREQEVASSPPFGAVFAKLRSVSVGRDPHTSPASAVLPPPGDEHTRPSHPAGDSNAQPAHPTGDSNAQSPQPQQAGDAVLVRTVCHAGALLRTTFHLPLSLFQAACPTLSTPPAAGAGGVGAHTGPHFSHATPHASVSGGPAPHQHHQGIGDALLSRLQRGVAAVLSSHGMSLGDVVSVMAWFDTSKVSPQLLYGHGTDANGCVSPGSPGVTTTTTATTTFRTGPGGVGSPSHRTTNHAGGAVSAGAGAFRIMWVPAVSVYSSACTAGCVAVLEVVAVAPNW